MVLPRVMLLNSNKKDNKTNVGFEPWIILLIGFLLGCILSASVLLSIQVNVLPASNLLSPLAQTLLQQHQQQQQQPLVAEQRRTSKDTSRDKDSNKAAAAIAVTPSLSSSSSSSSSSSTASILDGVKILVAIASYDFSQIPHLEEVLDGYFDLCAAGAKVHVVIHTTIAYPVTLIDLLNSRFQCQNPSPRAGFALTIAVKPSSLRLHLVDCHRTLFYDQLNEYDVFIYTEDDIRVSPRTVAAYLIETRRVATLVGIDQASNYNVGIARYEYNFPSNVVIDDKTRHATQNVTRVYWEHSRHPPIPDAVDAVPQAPLSQRYVHMTNHHQGMFMATRDLLQAWKVRPKCNFDQIRDRPGKGSQPSEGTQRVWMSSQMLYGGRHCHVQQVIPMDQFGALTVLHLPNKNYRRVGRYRNRTFADGTEVFDQPRATLLTAMQLHLSMRQHWPAQPQIPYQGIRMVDEVDDKRARTPLLERRMAEYQAYVERGGVMSLDDMTKTNLVELE
jgi:hypothetical protein